MSKGESIKDRLARLSKKKETPKKKTVKKEDK